MALLSHSADEIGIESLEKWEKIGSGGFGHVFKARHKDLMINVAIKLLRDGVGTKEEALFQELNHMGTASFEFVVRVYGIFEGQPPIRAFSMQKGIVMEFMSRGSVHDLLKDLSGPPPWPLAFRLANQVALGMNFLHSKNLIHHDLKPSNVLLNDELNAKITDFGLTRVSTSVLNRKGETTGEDGGTDKYMPPEAFDPSYQPVRSFDRYSYGILLWSVITGKEPYPNAGPSRIALKIPQGARPPCEEINQRNAEGLKELVDLMKMCWDQEPNERPTFKKCSEVTENVFSRHKGQIHSAVHEVVTKLKSPTTEQNSNTSVPSPQEPEQSVSPHDSVDHVRFISTLRSTQESVNVSAKTMSNTDKAKFVDKNRAALIQNVSEVMAIVDELGDMVHSETYSVIEAKPTDQARMRTLFQNTLRSGGVTVKATFYNVLQKHHPGLVEELDG